MTYERPHRRLRLWRQESLLAAGDADPDPRETSAAPTTAGFGASVVIDGSALTDGSDLEIREIAEAAVAALDEAPPGASAVLFGINRFRHDGLIEPVTLVVSIIRTHPVPTYTIAPFNAEQLMIEDPENGGGTTAFGDSRATGPPPAIAYPGNYDATAYMSRCRHVMCVGATLVLLFVRVARRACGPVCQDTRMAGKGKPGPAPKLTYDPVQTKLYLAPVAKRHLEKLAKAEEVSYSMLVTMLLAEKKGIPLHELLNNLQTHHNEEGDLAETA